MCTIIVWPCGLVVEGNSCISLWWCFWQQRCYRCGSAATRARLVLFVYSQEMMWQRWNSTTKIYWISISKEGLFWVQATRMKHKWGLMIAKEKYQAAQILSTTNQQVEWILIINFFSSHSYIFVWPFFLCIIIFVHVYPK